MFTYKKTILVFFSLTLNSQFLFADEFDKAVKRSHQMNLTHVNEARDGVPFYTEKTLDPTWDLNRTLPIVKIDNFSLIDQDGKKQTESIFNGKTTFVSFFFATCAGFCPTALRNLMGIEKQLKAKFKDIQFVAISVDPEKDNPQHLKKYATKLKLSPSWKLFTGNKEQIYSLARDTFAAEAFKLPKSAGQFAHSEHFYVLDDQRRLRGVLKGTRLDVANKAEDLIMALRSHVISAKK